MSVATAQVLLFTACVYIEIVVKFVSEVMDFFQSEKGGRKLVRDGYMYHTNTTLGNGSTYWWATVICTTKTQRWEMVVHTGSVAREDQGMDAKLKSHLTQMIFLLVKPLLILTHRIQKR